MKKKTEEEKYLARTIKDRDIELEGLRERLRTMEKDRDLYRNWMMTKMEWFLDLMEEGKSPSLKWLVKNAAETRGAGKP